MTITLKTLAACCCAFALFASRAVASRAGITNTAGRCDACHGEASAAVSVTIEGPSSLRVNEEAEYLVRISGRPLNAPGFNLRVRPWGAASLVAGEGGRLDIDLNELTHAAPRTPLEAAVVFPFRIRAAPTPNILSLVVAGNSVNLSDSSSGDKWNRATLLVAVTEAAVNFDGGGEEDPADGGALQSEPEQSVERGASGCSAAAAPIAPLGAVASWLIAKLGRARRRRSATCPTATNSYQAPIR